VAGGQIDVVQIDGETGKKVSEARALAIADPPVGGTKRLDTEQSQAGFTVKLKSISWTEDATRLVVEVTNNGAAKASLSAYDVVIQQGSRQFDLSDDDEGADELSDDINPGVTKKATLTFDKISRSRGKGYIEFEWLSDDYDIDSDNPFGFTMNW